MRLTLGSTVTTVTSVPGSAPLGVNLHELSSELPVQTTLQEGLGSPDPSSAEGLQAQVFPRPRSPTPESARRHRRLLPDLPTTPSWTGPIAFWSVSPEDLSSVTRHRFLTGVEYPIAQRPVIASDSATSVSSTSSSRLTDMKLFKQSKELLRSIRSHDDRSRSTTPLSPQTEPHRLGDPGRRRSEARGAPSTTGSPRTQAKSVAGTETTSEAVIREDGETNFVSTAWGWLANKLI